MNETDRAIEELRQTRERIKQLVKDDAEQRDVVAAINRAISLLIPF